ncbi:formate hydrogenlyase [Candidatus Falkowbacteria bacterium CG10_big_fil_rev_8_21_14_0_10_37_14]|uniref:Formate hydrogenlyase n=1 Tax=Candidatus Falkowbacteria bacterium CG10_big_fil_rev_8_21_14_0_10_37_14 TaxID=1974561 RepID=A0A2M6WU86_9BACT|nr:formate hydrogenlyase [Candidatus Falkowbacteria bacterium]PIT96362.1 MAG: formate hydrogenlyase [Candidatus Falkowbacteria bacterium CG10_big_fil_rev_8_21_14_0_10_37_14]
MIIFIGIIQAFFVPAVSPLFIGLIKKIKARFQNRQGASVFQSYRDIWKLLHKDEVISSDASWIFRLAPFIVFIVTVIVGASIPLFTTVFKQLLTSDLLIVIYTLAGGTFFLALAGLDTGSAFGGFASSREMTISALAEGSFVLSLFTVALIIGSTNLFVIADSKNILFNNFFLPTILAFFSFFIVMLAESGRFPFDNPATHLELTMIHEAMILEYSGKRLALMEWAAANKFFILAALGANLFFPWGIAQNLNLLPVAIGVIVVLVKIIIMCLVVAFIESVTAKFRFFRLPDLLITSIVLSAVAISLIQKI